jgi:hypothetical protein
MGALAPAIFGQSITVSTRNSKVLNTPLPPIISAKKSGFFFSFFLLLFKNINLDDI